MHPNFERPFTLDRVVRIIIGGLVLVGLFFLVSTLSGVLVPFLLAWLIAYLMFPMIRFFEKKAHVKNRFLAILISLVLVIGLLTVLGYFLIKPIGNEVTHLSGLISQYAQGNYNSSFFPDNWEAWFRKMIVLPEIQGFAKSQDWGQIAEKVIPSFWKVFSGGIDAILSIFIGFIMLLYVIFILKDYETISRGWLKLIPSKYRGFVTHLAEDLEDGMNRYFRGQATIALVVGILFSIGFAIIDLPLGIVLGIMLGMLNLVPYLQTIGFIPLSLMALLKSMETGQSFWGVMLGVLVVFAIVQAFQDGFLVPRIMGKRMGLNPAVILLSLSIWGALLGLVGLIIALPVTTLMIAYYRRFVLNESGNDEALLKEELKIEE